MFKNYKYRKHYDRPEKGKVYVRDVFLRETHLWYVCCLASMVCIQTVIANTARIWQKAEGILLFIAQFLGRPLKMEERISTSDV